jgi:hypothetical protein
MIIVSVKVPPPPAKCTCSVVDYPKYQVVTPEAQRVAGSVALQVATPEAQATSDIRLVLEYTIS